MDFWKKIENCITNAEIWIHTPQPMVDNIGMWITAFISLFYAKLVIKRKGKKSELYQTSFFDYVGIFSTVLFLFVAIGKIEHIIHDGLIVQGPHAWYVRIY